MIDLFNNPFRVLGIVANSSEREIQKQVSILRRYAEIGKFKTTEYDFDILGKFNRNLETINSAIKSIEQPMSKLKYAQFWFVSKSEVDKIALSYLNKNDISKAEEIWNKTLKEEVTNKNYTSYHNLSILYLFKGIDLKSNLDFFKMSIELKESLLDSKCSNDYVLLITSNKSINIDLREYVISEYIKILTELRKSVGMINIISFLKLLPQIYKETFIENFIKTPIDKIEQIVNKTKVNREKLPEKSNSLGDALYSDTRKYLNQIGELLGFTDIKYCMIVNKIASEILQCSITYFNHFKENSHYDPGKEALRVAELAQRCNPTGQVKSKIEENLPFLNDWIEDKPKRDKFRKVESQNKFLLQKLERFNNQRQISLEDVNDFITECKPKLNEIANVFGNYDEDYLQVSSIIALNSQSIVVEIFNNVQKNLMDSVNSYMSDYQKRNMLESAYDIFSKCNTIMNRIANLHMNSETKKQVENNRIGINDVTNDIHKILHPPTRQSYSIPVSKPTQSSGGCYIATMVYKDYDHPQVLKLRRFRDDVLLQNILGKLFVILYYQVSPIFVRIFRKNKYVNFYIRKILDKIIREIEL